MPRYSSRALFISPRSRKLLYCCSRTCRQTKKYRFLLKLTTRPVCPANNERHLWLCMSQIRKLWSAHELNIKVESLLCSTCLIASECPSKTPCASRSHDSYFAAGSKWIKTALQFSPPTTKTFPPRGWFFTLLQHYSAFDSIVFEAPNELYLTTNFYVSKLVTLRTPSNVVDTICFWSFEKSHDITTDSDSVFLNTGAVGLRVSYKQTSWSLPQVATRVESLFHWA